MSSMLDQATQMATTQFNKMRWAVGLTGLLSVAFGATILIWPGISLYALTIVFGAFVTARGLVGLATALSGAIPGRGWLVVSSLLSITVGVIALVWTNISALALLYVIGAYAVALGVMAVAGAFSLPLDGGDTALLVLSGLVSVLFGIVIFAKPGAGALAVLALIAAFALVTGISEVVVAIGGKRLLERRVRTAFGIPKTQTSS